MKDKIFDLCIRVIKTMAQTAVACIGTTAYVMSDVNWGIVLSSSLLSGIVCLLMNIANIKE